MADNFITCHYCNLILPLTNIKNIFIIKENDLSYGRGYVYSLQYHLVWCTKYRKKVLQNGLDEECKKMLYEIAIELKPEGLLCNLPKT